MYDISRQYLIYFIISVAFGLNAVTAIIIIVKSSLEKSENILLLNNLLYNLSCICLMGPQLLKHGPFDCITVEFTVSFFTVSNSMCIFLISYDQFINITDPFQYQQKLKMKKVLCAIVLQWILSFLNGLLSSFASTPAPGVWKICKFPNELPEEIVLDNYRYFLAALLIFGTLLCFSAIVFMQCSVIDAAFCRYVCHSLHYPKIFISAQGDEEISGVDKYVKVTKTAVIIIFYYFISQIPLAMLQVYSRMAAIPYHSLLLGSVVTPFLFLYQKRQLKLELCKIWTLLKTFKGQIFNKSDIHPLDRPAEAETIPSR